MIQRELFDKREPRAVFSGCGRYRYFLAWPTGLDNDRTMAVCAANPSKAGQRAPDGTMRSDPTVSRLRNLALELGFGWLWVVNARAWIATDPNDVPADPLAIGEGDGVANDEWIECAAHTCELFVCAFGHLAGARGAFVLEIARRAGKVPHALALARDGTPRHPRGIPSSARPFPIQATRRAQ